MATAIQRFFRSMLQSQWATTTKLNLGTDSPHLPYDYQLQSGRSPSARICITAVSSACAANSAFAKAWKIGLRLC
ncbi:hypothetical protein ASE04_28350 [Rhizobium sp. Root708]|nr:hypothetical protein ASE04_28350 [Rhizobium sp. Root708]